MSVDAIAYVKTLDVDNPMSRLLLFIIGENTFNDTCLCKVGQQVLAEETRASDRTVREHLKKLEQAGVLIITPQPKSGGGRGYDAIEIVGFREWLGRNRPPPRTPQPDPEPEDFSGSGEAEIPSGSEAPVAEQTGKQVPDRTGRQASGSNNDSRTNPVLNPPQSPPEGGGGGKFQLDWIEELRREGCAPQVLDHFLLPLIAAGLKPWKDADPRSVGRQLCEDFKRRSPEVLREAADRLLDTHRHRLPPVAAARAAVKAAGDRAALAAIRERVAAASEPEMQRFNRGTPEYERELARWRREDPDWAARIESQGFVRLRVERKEVAA